MWLKMDFKLAVIVFLYFRLCIVIANEMGEGFPCDMADGTAGVCLKLSDCRRANEDLKKFVLPKICSLNLWDPIVCCLDCNFIEDRFYDINVQFALKFQLDINIEDVENKIAEYKRKNIKCLEAAHIIQHFPCNRYEEFQDLDDSVKCYDNPYDTESLEATHDESRVKQRHLALIGFGEHPASAEWPCSGAIISIHYILAAAHCASNPVIGQAKFAAMGNVQNVEHRRDWQIYEVAQVTVHPHYVPPSKYHDIAVLKTRDKIRYNVEVIPACLQRGELLTNVATAIGWNAVGPLQHPSELLKGVDIIRFSDGDCMEAYHKHRYLMEGFIGTIQTCYGDADIANDKCQGDSGGILQVRTKRQRAKCLHTIIGVAAYGRACGLFGTAGLYTKVAAYVPWIETVTGRLS